MRLSNTVLRLTSLWVTDLITWSKDPRRYIYRQFTINGQHLFLLEFITERSLRGCQVWGNRAKDWLFISLRVSWTSMGCVPCCWNIICTYIIFLFKFSKTIIHLLLTSFKLCSQNASSFARSSSRTCILWKHIFINYKSTLKFNRFTVKYNLYI